MTEAGAPPAAGLRVRGLVVSRVVDQAALGLGSLVLARHLGPEAFAPVATLFVFNSLAVQLADQGASFALLRSPPGTTLSTVRLRRMRVVNAVVVALGLARLPDYAAVAPVLHVMSISFLLDLPSEFRVKMLERELNWRRLRLLQSHHRHPRRHQPGLRRRKASSVTRRCRSPASERRSSFAPRSTTPSSFVVRSSSIARPTGTSP